VALGPSVWRSYGLGLGLGRRRRLIGWAARLEKWALALDDGFGLGMTGTTGTTAGLDE